MAPKNPPPSKKRTRSSTTKKNNGGNQAATPTSSSARVPPPSPRESGPSTNIVVSSGHISNLKPFADRANPRQSKFFYDHLLTRNLHFERGIDLPALDSSIAEEVKRRSWTKFVAHPKQQFNVTLLKEFLGLVYQTKETTTSVIVRGVKVDFSPAAIMRHFGIPDFPVKDHYEFAWDVEDLSKRSAKITEAQNFLDKKANWVEGRFKYVGVSPVAKVWSNFVNSRIIPSSHLHTINRDEALAIYAIMTKTPIHVGHVIHKAIIQFVTKEGPTIPFPNTIAEMVAAAKAPRSLADQISQAANSAIIGAKLVASSSSSSSSAVTNSVPPPAPKPPRKQVYLSGFEDLRADIAALRSDIHAGFERQRVWAEDTRVGICGVRSVVDSIARGASFNPDCFPRMSSTPYVYEPWVVPPTSSAPAPAPPDVISVPVPILAEPSTPDVISVPEPSLAEPSTVSDAAVVEPPGDTSPTEPETLIDNANLQASFLMDSLEMLAAQTLCGCGELRAPFSGDDLVPKTVVIAEGSVNEVVTAVPPADSVID